MERLIFLAGIATSLGGVALMLYQGIMYLMHNAWTSYSLYLLVDHGPQALKAQVDMSPAVMNALETCPLFLFVIIVGLLLTLLGSRLSGRYLN